MTIDVKKLADSIPDDPRWIDTRGLLLSGRCKVLAPRRWLRTSLSVFLAVRSVALAVRSAAPTPPIRPRTAAA